MLRTASIASLTVLLTSGGAFAQQQPPPEQQGEYQQQPPPEQQGEYQQQPPPAQQGTFAEDEDAYGEDGSIRVVEQGSPEAQEMTAEEGRGIEAGGHLLIPFYVDRPDLTPGIGVQGRFGWEFPHGVTVELNIGVQTNRFDHFLRSGFLTAFWIGGGARYSFLNPSAFVPFVGLNLQVSFWSQCVESGGSCEGDVTTAGFGLTPLVGVAFELNPQLALEVGVQGTLTFFDENSKLVQRGGARTTEGYISPFLGGTFYF